MLGVDAGRTGAHPRRVFARVQPPSRTASMSTIRSSAWRAISASVSPALGAVRVRAAPACDRGQRVHPAGRHDVVVSASETIFHPYGLILTGLSIAYALVVLYVITPTGDQARGITHYIPEDDLFESASDGGVETTATFNRSRPSVSATAAFSTESADRDCAGRLASFSPARRARTVHRQFRLPDDWDLHLHGPADLPGDVRRGGDRRVASDSPLYHAGDTSDGGHHAHRAVVDARSAQQGLDTTDVPGHRLAHWCRGRRLRTVRRR